MQTVLGSVCLAGSGVRGADQGELRGSDCHGRVAQEAAATVVDRFGHRLSPFGFGRWSSGARREPPVWSRRTWWRHLARGPPCHLGEPSVEFGADDEAAVLPAAVQR